MVVEDDNFIIYGPEPAEPLLNTTLGEEILRSFLGENDLHLDVMVDASTGQTLSRKELLETSLNIAEALRTYGYRPGTVISISSENNLEFFYPVLGAMLVGCIVASLNHNYTPRELTHALNISKPKIIFCSVEVSSKYIELKKQLNYVDKIVIINSTESVIGADTLEEFVRKGLGGRRVVPDNFRPFVGDPVRTGAFILCSSGTTGLPKGVLLSHKNILTRVQQSRDPRYLDNLRHNQLGLLPFFHGFGLNITLNGILNKYRIAVIRKYNEDLFLKAIQDYRITVLHLAPPLAIFLEKTHKICNYDMSSVQTILCGAAPLGKSTEIGLKRRFKNLKDIQQAYGLTESTLGVTVMDKGVSRPGSSGKVVTYMSCKIRDPETGKSLGSNQVGELCFKGPMVMMGYYNDEKATRETFTSDGWLKTGDLGYYDDEEFFYVVDRLKELIKYKGFQVAPAELEAILIMHPCVRDVGVAGLPDELAGEVPVAFVVKETGAEITSKELEDHVAGLVSPEKRLRGGVIFVTEIPKNPSGKILRRVLRERLKNYREEHKSKI